MKTADQWLAEYPSQERWHDFIKAIQADALRHAARIVRETGGANAEEHAMAIEWHGSVLLKS